MNIIHSYCDHVEDPFVGVAVEKLAGHIMPSFYKDILRIANGFVTKNNIFRFLGIKPSMPALDLYEWNRSPWVTEYSYFADRIVFIAEDIFGDQYGLQFASQTDQNPVLIKFWCEGGQVEAINTVSLYEWLTANVLRDEPTILDWPLVKAAFNRGLFPSVTEHLSFELPLMVGGKIEENNLEVLDRSFHLHLLGQLSLKNTGLSEGTKITRFSTES